jgi:protein-S-isoprenylcysteine O-methyltransferase Ste14
MKVEWLDVARASPVDVAASAAVSICAAVVLLAVARSFVEARTAGPVARRRRSVVETGTMLLFLLAVWLLVRLRLGVVPVSSPFLRGALALVGVGPVVVGCVVNLAGRRHLGRNWANQVTVYRDQSMVTSGVFGYVRHPLYASLIWMFLGAALVYRNWAVLLATVFVFLPAMHYRAAQEEELLEQRFPRYAAYRRHVGRFFPRSVRGYDDDRE